LEQLTLDAVEALADGAVERSNPAFGVPRVRASARKNSSSMPKP